MISDVFLYFLDHGLVSTVSEDRMDSSELFVCTVQTYKLIRNLYNRSVSSVHLRNQRRRIPIRKRRSLSAYENSIPFYFFFTVWIEQKPEQTPPTMNPTVERETNFHLLYCEAELWADTTGSDYSINYRSKSLHHYICVFLYRSRTPGLCRDRLGPVCKHRRTELTMWGQTCLTIF